MGRKTGANGGGRKRKACCGWMSKGKKSPVLRRGGEQPDGKEPNLQGGQRPKGCELGGSGPSIELTRGPILPSLSCIKTQVHWPTSKGTFHSVCSNLPRSERGFLPLSYHTKFFSRLVGKGIDCGGGGKGPSFSLARWGTFVRARAAVNAFRKWG